MAMRRPKPFGRLMMMLGSVGRRVIRDQPVHRGGGGRMTPGAVPVTSTVLWRGQSRLFPCTVWNLERLNSATSPPGCARCKSALSRRSLPVLPVSISTAVWHFAIARPIAWPEPQAIPIDLSFPRTLECVFELSLNHLVPGSIAARQGFPASSRGGVVRDSCITDRQTSQAPHTRAPYMSGEPLGEPRLKWDWGSISSAIVDTENSFTNAVRGKDPFLTPGAWASVKACQDFRLRVSAPPARDTIIGIQETKFGSLRARTNCQTGTGPLSSSRVDPSIPARASQARADGRPEAREVGRSGSELQAHTRHKKKKKEEALASETDDGGLLWSLGNWGSVASGLPAGQQQRGRGRKQQSLDAVRTLTLTLILYSKAAKAKPFVSSRLVSRH
ncbi:hypothetical protein CSOJ01_04520 [Colletotrichum sojae]|uniref:Uncharacterized protein n=1 Tax=Colletotrichum sojae TaxID=2175907 RepID=A0A8H6JJ66_9PEZI|nr:hypothetical protein CSOJ01_04520 [Colletotrichum sojae]